MPTFVPVVDVETPASERNPNSSEYAKHRKWEVPHLTKVISNSSHLSKESTNRGWEQGNVGWGVLGSFGSNAKDDGSHIRRSMESSDNSQKMIKNEKGLWVKVKEVRDQKDSHGSYDINDASERKSRGRGSGIPVFSHSSYTSYGLDSNPQDKKSNDNKRKYDDSYDYERRKDKPRYRSRSSSRERYQKHLYRNESSSKSSQDGYRDDSRDRRDRKDRRDEKRSGRYDSRDRTHRNHDNNNNNDNNSNDNNNNNNNNKIDIDIVPIVVENSNEVNPMADITAVQVVNRLLEVFQQQTKRLELRIENIMELFTESAKISSLKTGKDLVVGSENIRNSYSKTMPCSASTAKRLFIEGHGTISYCLDIHHPGSTPGLGDRSRDAILLYKCQDAKIIQVWGMIDQESLASPAILNGKATKADLLNSNAWKLSKVIVGNDIPDLDEDKDIHYHDYDHIETWG